MFLVPLDNERRWYRYHQLFGELLRLRLPQSIASSPGEAESQVNALHIRASQWYEEHGLSMEAFHHAAAAHEIERAEHLLDGKGMPRHFRGAVTALLAWLESLPKTVLAARPSLWVRSASLLLVNGHTTGVEEKLQAAEAALQGAEPGGFIRTFVDEGLPMAHLLSAAAVLGRMPDYVGKLLAVCAAEEHKSEDTSSLPPPAPPLIEPLSPREWEVLHLMAQGLSNQEMSQRLFLALDTVKGHNRKIFGKLQVQRRTEAVARARALGLL